MGRLKTETQQWVTAYPELDGGALEKARLLFKRGKARQDGWQEATWAAASLWCDQVARCRDAILRDGVLSAGLRRVARLDRRPPRSPQVRYELLKARRLMEDAERLRQDVADLLFDSGIDVATSEWGRAQWMTLSRLLNQLQSGEVDGVAPLPRITEEAFAAAAQQEAKRGAAAELHRVLPKLLAVLKKCVGIEEAKKMAPRVLDETYALFTPENTFDDLAAASEDLIRVQIEASASKKSGAPQDPSAPLVHFLRAWQDKPRGIAERLEALIQGLGDPADTAQKQRDAIMTYLRQEILPDIPVPADTAPAATPPNIV